MVGMNTVLNNLTWPANSCMSFEFCQYHSIALNLPRVSLYTEPSNELLSSVRTL